MALAPDLFMPFHYGMNLSAVEIDGRLAPPRHTMASRLATARQACRLRPAEASRHMGCLGGLERSDWVGLVLPRGGEYLVSWCTGFREGTRLLQKFGLGPQVRYHKYRSVGIPKGPQCCLAKKHG
jgi:hypothetical protein